MKKLLPVVAGILVAGAVVGALVGVGRLPAGSQETGGAGRGELRWLDVTLQLPPEDSPLHVTRLPPFSPERPRFIVQIYVERELTPGVEPAPQMVEIDAETGEVVSDTLSPALSDQAVSSQLQAVLDSVGIDSGPPEIWPYADVPSPALAADPPRWGNVTFILPDPASGIIVSPTIQDCFAPDCTSKTLTVYNGHSQMGIDAETGEIMGLDRVTEEDRAAFQRYAASVQVQPP